MRGKAEFGFTMGLCLKHSGAAKKNAAIAAWRYPQGGKAISKLYGIAQGKDAAIYDLAVSVAPSRSPIHK
jgi:hypothetical protein